MTTMTRDSGLTDALAALYGYLDLGTEEVVDASADAFIGALANHLHWAEGGLFPALRDSLAAAEEELKPLREEHDSLRVFASELAQRVAVNDRGGAKAVAASMLAALVSHLGREEKAVNDLLDRLHPGTRDRLLRMTGDVEE
jgi:hypothetical protein